MSWKTWWTLRISRSGWRLQLLQELLEGDGARDILAALGLGQALHRLADVFHAQISPLLSLRSFMV